MKYAYCRVSTQHQNLDRQIKNVSRYAPDAKVYSDKFTGTSLARPEWVKLCKQLKPGDTVIFDSVSRMSRNEKEGFKTYMLLFNKGINLEFIKEPQVNTSVYKNALERKFDLDISTGKLSTDNLISGILEVVNKLVWDMAQEQIELAFQQAEKELTDIRQRTKEGIAVARSNGKQIGQKQGATLIIKKELRCKEIIFKHSNTFGGDLNDKECIKLCECSRNTFYKYKRELKEEAVLQEQALFEIEGETI